MAQKKNAGPSAAVIAGLAVVAVAQIGAIGFAHADISKRGEKGLNGSEPQWRMLSLLPFGPLLYFVRGRR